MDAARRWRDDAGQAVVLIALGMSVLFAAAGVAVDGAQLYVQRRHEQVGADAAAFAAATELVKNWSSPTRADLARSAALAYAAANGYGASSVAVNIPPTTGPRAGNADFAEVIISRQTPTAFMRIFGPAFATREVRARAVGGITAPPKPYSIYALSRTAGPAFHVNGNAEVEAEGAGILVNSSAANAFTMSGANPEVEAESGGIDVAGGASVSAPGQPEGTLTTGVAPVPDPLVYLSRPQVSGPIFSAVSVTSGTVTLDPGIYPSISVSGNGTVKLRPGIYVIAGGGVSVSGNGKLQSEAIDDAGVLLFNACSGYPVASGSCGAISVSGNGNMDLHQNVSQYPGLSIWQPCENTQPLSVTGSGAPPPPGRHPHSGQPGELETDGAIYLPCAGAKVAGNGEIEIENGQLIANTVDADGNGEIEVEWESAGASAARFPAVVE